MAIAKKILRTPLRILIALFLVGMLMRVLDWPFTNQVLLISFFGIGILYCIRFYRKQEKRFVDYVKLVLVVFWTANGIFPHFRLSVHLGLSSRDSGLVFDLVFPRRHGLLFG